MSKTKRLILLLSLAVLISISINVYSYIKIQSQNNENIETYNVILSYVEANLDSVNYSASKLLEDKEGYSEMETLRYLSSISESLKAAWYSMKSAELYNNEHENIEILLNYYYESCIGLQEDLSAGDKEEIFNSLQLINNDINHILKTFHSRDVLATDRDILWDSIISELTYKEVLNRVKLHVE